MKAIIISAADAGYWPLLSGLLHSIERGVRSEGFAVGILDLGLTSGQRERLQKYGAELIEPGWDYALSHFRESPPATFKAMTARPYLPRYFSGYDLYIWLDADCWVQEWRAVTLLAGAALHMKFAIVPEVHRSYESYLVSGASCLEFFHGCYKVCYGEKDANYLCHFPLLNCGVFSATPDAPHWMRWQSSLGDVLGRLAAPFFYAEQTAINYVVRHQKLATAFLPAYCNWICSRATPKFDAEDNVFVEPDPPYSPLGVIHLASAIKDRASPILDQFGKTHMRTLTYPPLPESEAQAG